MWNRQLLFFIYILAGSAGTKLQSLCWFAEGLMKRWAKTQMKPQLHSTPRTHREWIFLKTGERSANNKKLERKVYLASSGRSKPAGRKTEAGSGAELYTYCLRPCGFFSCRTFQCVEKMAQVVSTVWVTRTQSEKPRLSEDISEMMNMLFIINLC